MTVGTNYYLHQIPCPSCQRSDRIHIGKWSGGWSFGFRGYRHDPDEWLLSPFGRAVLSRADWVQAIDGYDGHVLDEYGRQVDDPIAWLTAFVAPDARQCRWEDSNMGPYWRPDEREWRDAEGFRFYDGDFS